MIDHVWKTQMDRGWDRVARAFVRAGISANSVTLASFACVTASAVAFLWHQHWLVFAVSVGLFELLDNVDGAIARVSDSKTRAGAFLDATTDRLKEVAMFAAAAHVSGAHTEGLLALSLGLAASYNLARGQAEGATFLGAWPPLFERLERIALLCLGAALASSWPVVAGRATMSWVLWLEVAGNAITALQRLLTGFWELSRRD